MKMFERHGGAAQNKNSQELSEKIAYVKKIVQGSRAWNLGSNPVDDIGLIAIDQIKNAMNISEFNQEKFCCQVTNGDYGANPFIVTGTYIKDGILQVKCNRAVKESVRLNFIFFYSI